MLRGHDIWIMEEDGVPMCVNHDADYSQCLRVLNHDGPCVFPPPEEEDPPVHDYTRYVDERFKSPVYNMGRGSGRSVFSTLFES